MPATSEPASGSVIAIAPIFSPAIAGPQVPLAQVVAAELAERRRAHVGLDRDRHREPAAAAPGQLLDEHQPGGQVAAGAAPALGVVEAEEPELAAAPEHVVGEVTGVLPLVDVGPQLLVDVPADRLAQLVVLLGEDRVGGSRRPFWPCLGLFRPMPDP